ncbi:uncharacterized protein LY89DRAFT_338204 [Mollisia scopiformis]|uniref:RNA-dependent RNA polymerase n=1 Tax=Mollisia scopiformis TaxID=149040 RepID=A0A132B8K7_MOLSC|nr:uncharacterized protein LY89DRAFT_338204 [Mollisia scopiformis]KUJ08214.1 hypothetical protein LY89DRAFT_338204 [Mollisia scopiformis]
MAPSAISDPNDPVRTAKKLEVEKNIKRIINNICNRWGLGLELPKENESPSHRQAHQSIEEKCVFMIKGISWKDMPKILEIAGEFEKAADGLYDKWVHKPRADRGVVPDKTRHRTHPVTADERQTLLDCLHKMLRDVWEEVKTPRATRYMNPNDSAVPFSLTGSLNGSTVEYPVLRTSSGESKRARDEPFPDITPTKKVKPDVLQSRSSNSMLPPAADSFTGRGRSVTRDPKGTRSADTSFASSIFDTQDSGSFPSTQATIPDDIEPTLPSKETRPSFINPQPDKIQSSDYASSSFEARVADVPEDVIILNDTDDELLLMDEPEAEELSQDLLGYTIDDDKATLSPKENQLKRSLQSVFPILPATLEEKAPVCVLYEITRVFLHAEVPLSEFNAPVTSSLNDYQTLWAFLKSLPPLRGKSFPERCSDEIWACALKDYEKGFYSVSFSGSLSFNTTSLDPMFQLRLDPLKFEYSHRLGRKFGHDRFLELSIPQLTGRHIPKAVQRLADSLEVGQWKSKVFDWLVDSRHPLLGRKWQPFFTKPKDRTSKRREATTSEAIYRVFFFAVDGFQFVNNTALMSNPDYSLGHPSMSIRRLLDHVRPTRANIHQTYLKLFNRTTLAVSRNQETVILEKSQIRFKEDIRWGPKNEVMNDGAGRISPSLALKITQKLCLSYLPSGFQARLGEAKGFWLVDHTDTKGEDWIEVYESQQKWIRSTEPKGPSDDRSHRAFEVLRYSGPLKSADLNTQLLPILLDRAKDPKAMRDALSDLLRQGLEQEVAEIQAAMESPANFKKWIRAGTSGTNDRLKHGAVPYRAGLPISKEEQLNVMLDAGFDPTKLSFMNKLAREVFKRKCDDLKERMNITVGRSTYAYMVPDFWGVLEPDEVYIDFSSFVDNVSSFSGASLSGENVLVARSPAHFVSDIQKVKAVVKAELMGLKDVIVFPTKGNPSLADKLSGGDYDGDIAWVCWEPTIVKNFVTAEVCEPIHLVDEGLLSKDSTRYEDLVRNESKVTAVPTFLKKSFEFNMQSSMLGICTNYKEGVCYTQGNVDTEEARYLSQLLSNLVDQAKQGYLFDEDSWRIFRLKKAIPNPKPLKRKDKNWVPRGPSSDIIEHLLWVADDAVNKSLQDFKEKGSYFDEDLVARFKHITEQSKDEPELKVLLKDLDQDLLQLKDKWQSHFSRAPNDDSKPEFQSYLVAIYDEYLDIQPHAKNLASKLLLCEDGQNPELSEWEKLKASALFASYRRSYVGNLVWWMAGKQLCYLKASRRGAGPGALHAVTSSMYILNKPDASMIRRLQNEGYGAGLDEDLASVVNVHDLEDREDD